MARCSMLRAGKGRFPYNEGKNLIVVLELYAYADESGLEQNPPYCLVAGHIGSPRMWMSFADAWKKVLTEYGVSEFHAKKFFTRSRRGEYVGWSDSKADGFISALVKTLTSRRLTPIGGAVEVPAFNALSIGERRALTGANWSNRKHKFTTTGAPYRPYFVPFIYFMKEALKRTPNDAKLNFIFHVQNVMAGHAVQMFREICTRPDFIERNKLGKFTFAESRDEVGLQAADLLAHEWYSYATSGMDMTRQRLIAMRGLAQRSNKFAAFGAIQLDQLLCQLFSPEERDKVRLGS